MSGKMFIRDISDILQPIFSSTTLMVSGLTFKSLNQLNLFLYMTYDGDLLSFYCIFVSNPHTIY